MRLLLFLLLLVSAPALAQTAPSAAELDEMNPDAVLAQLWGEAFGSATATTWALGDADSTDWTHFEADTLGGDALPYQVDVRQALMTTATAAASASSHLSAALQFSLALADSSERPEIYAALGEDTLALHLRLVRVAEEAGRSILATSPADFDTSSSLINWAEEIDQINVLVARLKGATAALGLTAPDP